MNRLLEGVLSVGFLKWLFDGIRFVWTSLYKKRVTVDFYIAFHRLDSSGALEKSMFLIVRNGTDKDIVVDMLLWEDHFWYRHIRKRKAPRIVINKPIVRVPAQKAMQYVLQYVPGNVINPASRYFGVRLTSGKLIWVKTRHWILAVKEYKNDFPNWAEHPLPLLQLRYKEYGRIN